MILNEFVLLKVINLFSSRLFTPNIEFTKKNMKKLNQVKTQTEIDLKIRSCHTDTQKKLQEKKPQWRNCPQSVKTILGHILL